MLKIKCAKQCWANSTGQALSHYYLHPLFTVFREGNSLHMVSVDFMLYGNQVSDSALHMLYLALAGCFCCGVHLLVCIKYTGVHLLVCIKFASVHLVHCS